MNDVLDETEVAALLDCEPSTVKEKAREGDLPGVKYGRSWRFPRTALLEALHAKAMANKPKPTPQPKAVLMKRPKRTLPNFTAV